MSSSTPGHETSRGIGELIEKIREKGVEAGRAESARLIEDAERRAEWILEQAEAEAAGIREQAEADASFIRKAGTDALNMAFRDIKMKLRDELSRQFARQLNRLIVQELKEPETLKMLLISAAGRSKLPDEAVSIRLPAEAAGLQQLRDDPGLLEGGPLMEMVSEIARELFTRGVEVDTGAHAQAGMQVFLRDGEVVVDLTEQALASLILEHLQPRFRAVLEGVVG